LDPELVLAVLLQASDIASWIVTLVHGWAVRKPRPFMDVQLAWLAQDLDAVLNIPLYENAHALKGAWIPLHIRPCVAWRLDGDI
jgi:hypothetical protein